MRWIHAWLLLWCVGCFSPSDPEGVALNGEREATADRVLRALGVDNAVVVERSLPQPDELALGLHLRKQRLSVAPGDSGTIALGVTGLGEESRIATLRLGLARGDSYLEVPRVSDTSSRKDALEARFTVAEDACSQMCNRRHEAEVLVSVALADGRQSARAILSVELDCSVHGRAELCEASLSTSYVRYVDAIAEYQQALCECGLEPCEEEKQSLPVTFDCMLEALPAHAPRSDRLADCMAEELESIAECMTDEVCDPLFCADPNKVFELTRSCGLERGPLNDQLTECMLDRRTESQVECGLSVLPTEWLCDFSFECSSGLDELACPLPFQCAIGQGEVGLAWTCNGAPDCSNGEDEGICPDDKVLTPF